MMRSAVSLPPSCEDTALVRIVKGMVAVSALEARAIERSKPATFWNRLTTRSTNSGRSQNVRVRVTRSRSSRAFGLSSWDPSPAMAAVRRASAGCQLGREELERGACLGLLLAGEIDPVPSEVDPGLG